MALDVQRLHLTDDHTLESATEVMSQLQFDRRLPNSAYDVQELLRDLGFRSQQDGVEHTQFVFQGQCLILGDARVGKTSLKKSLMGIPFDADEPGTKGVEMSVVDRKWRNLRALAGLKFGSFARFRKSALYQGVLYGPAGIEFKIDEEVTSAMSAIAHLLFMFCRIAWVLSSIILWLWAFATVSVGFSALSVAAFLLEVLLQQLLPSEHPQVFKLALLFTSLPRFLTGLGTAHLLAGYFRRIECQNVDSSLGDGMRNDAQFMWVTHLLIVAMLVNGISCEFVFLLLKHFRNANILGGVESAIPGQLKLSSPLPLAPELLLLMIPVMGGFSFGCVIHLLTNMTALNYCNILHFGMGPIFCVVMFRLVKLLFAWANVQRINFTCILVLYIITVRISEHVSLTSFCPLTAYVLFFAGWAFHSFYEDWDNMFFLFHEPFTTVRETQASFTFIFIEKVMLNFQKLRKALQDMFSSLKVKILDFSGDEEYYAYHHIFLRDHAIYLVVFNMANFADDNFRNVTAKIQRLCFWLESICSKAAPKTPIFFVGTHRGHMENNCLKRIDKYLRQNLLACYDDELVRNEEDKLLYFPIENSRGKNDSGVQNLQRKIMSTAEELKTTMGREIPFSWIKIQDAIIDLRQKKDAKFCVTLKQFPVSVGSFICSNWSRETLKYFHEKGLVIYVDHGQDSKLSPWILLKPEILIDIIIQLVTPLADHEETSQHGFRRDLKLLHNKGMLTESLLTKILSRWQENEEGIKKLLEEHDIICPLFNNVENKEEAEVTHFVPSLLPVSVDENTPVWYDDPTDKRFFVFFKRFLPEALFPHLLSRAHRLSMEEFPTGQPVIYRDVGRFWFRPAQPYRLLVLKKENMVEVTFSCRLVFIVFIIIMYMYCKM